MSPKLEVYRQPLAVFLPGLAEAQVEQRCAIMEMRDRATNALRRATGDAALVLGVLESIAVRHAIGPMTDEQTEMIWACCVSLMHTAEILRRHEPRD